MSNVFHCERALEREPFNGGPMKKIRVIAFVISSMIVAAPFAGAQSAQPGARTGNGAVRAQRGMERGGKRGGLMHGLKLSAAEKLKLKSVHEKYSAETRPMRESLRSAREEARVDRQKGDTAAARAVLARTKSSRESLRAVMEREKNEIRASLAPANQKQFDANVKQASAVRGRNGKAGAGRKGGRRANISNV